MLRKHFVNGHGIEKEVPSSKDLCVRSLCCVGDRLKGGQDWRHGDRLETTALAWERGEGVGGREGTDMGIGNS